MKLGVKLLISIENQPTWEVPVSKALVFAILAPVLYALANVILEHKYAKYNNLTVLIVVYATVFVLAVAVRQVVKTTGPSFDFPSGNELLFCILGLSVVFFFADYFFIGAYTNGGDILTITILTLLFPVFASLFKFIGSKFIDGMTYTQPNPYQMGGYALAIIAVLLVVKGSPVK